MCWLCLLQQDLSNQISVAESQKAEVTIIVSDVNDNNPSFTKSVYEMSISEAAIIGSTVGSVTANDLDEGTNGVIVYYIADPSSRFSMNSSTGLITLQNTLDWFTTKNYTLYARSSDGGDPKRHSLTQVNINVLDVNGKPVFNPSEYTINVNEATRKDASLLKIMSQDHDSAENNVVTLEIVGGNVESKFYIDKDVLKLKNVLDYEKTKTYKLTVSARDSGNPSLFATPNAVININVVNNNDNQPQFTLNPYHIQILEGSTGLLIKVEAKDKDGSSAVTYSLELNAEDAALFDIVSTGGQIFLKTPLDFEKKQQYAFSVRATDNTNPNFYSIALVLVTVQDVNDNKPVFAPANYVFSVNDNLPVGTILGAISATDADSGTNGQVSYLLKSGLNVPFEVTGNHIILKSKLDYTLNSSYQFNVVAKDNAVVSVQLKSSPAANVTIVVQKTNGTAPEFKQELYTVSVSDNITSTHVIVRVQALDTDSGSYGNIVYSIKASTDSNPFTIDKNNGDITLKTGNLLSYATKNRHILYIQASDGVGSFDIAYVVIKVEGQVRPQFTPFLYYATILDSTVVGFTVLTVYASNADTYSIISGNDLGKFSLPIQGILKLNKALTKDDPKKFELVISATNNLGKISNPNATITINVVSANNVTVNFKQSMYKYSINENEQSKIVGTVIAETSSLATNDISYQIAYNTDVTSNDFIVNNISGQISSVRSFDREVKSEYAFQVIATFNGIKDKSLVNIIINDINDEAPIFLSNLQTVYNVSEFSRRGSVIAVVQATDKDVGDNGQIIYSLHDNFNGSFLVSLIGVVTLGKTLDYENKNSYSLIVIASDLGIPTKATNLSLTIDVDNENDGRPVFQSTKYTQSISESNSNVSNIIQVKATDVDAFAGGLRYRFIDNELPFAINSITGWISSTATLDYETIKSFQFCVEAYDSGTPQLSSITNVHISILDSNDNNPIFNPTLYNTKVLKSVAVNTVIGHVNATDADLSRNGQLTYTIVNGNTGNAFRVDSHGDIIVIKNLDKSQYVLNISAEDNGTTPRTSVVNAVFTVDTLTACVNNSSAGIVTFERDVYNITIAENFNILTTLLTVKATITGSQGNVLYEIQDPQSMFKVDSNGIVMAKSSFDYEVWTEHVLSVIGKDSLNPAISSTTTVRVNVTDVNDNPPVFSQVVYTMNIREDAAINDSVGLVFGN